MHDTAYEIGGKFIRTYWRSQFRSILDVGSRNLNGTLRDFCPEGARYVGVDIEDGAGVDAVLEDPSRFPFEDESFDLVVSTSCFEHDRMFWLTFLEICRVLKTGGFIYLNAPSNGQYHSYPYDNWRFYPDAGYALEAWAKKNGYSVSLVESFVGRRKQDIWNDFVAVFGKHRGRRPAKRALLASQFPDAMNIRTRDNKVVKNLVLPTEDMERAADARQQLEDRDCEARELTARLHDQEAQLAEREGYIAGLNQAVAYLNQTVAEANARIADLNALREGEVRELNFRLEAQEKLAIELTSALSERDKAMTGVKRELVGLSYQVAAFRNSYSWRLTAPLRAVSSRAPWIARNTRRARKLVRWLGRLPS
jgi:SAM-dependent methyltransferase/uncharacterized coiled-coil protein SlyX